MATYTDNYNLIKPSYAEIADVAVINTNMNTIDDIMHSSQVSLAPAYDSTQTYNTGDVVMYELLMYKCKENGVTGTWNASKWERTTASECGDSGSDVEANPSGTATEELNKLRVNNTIYSIPEGSEVVVYGEASGSIAEFDDGSNKPMSKCKIDINAVQSGSGDPSPDNIRPISGWTEANIARTGKNLFDQDTAYAPYKTADNTYLATGSQLTVISIEIPSAFIGKQVTFSAYISGDNMPTNVRVRAFVNGLPYSGNSVSKNGFSSITFIPKTASDAVGITYGSSGEKYITLSSCQLEISSERTAYEPYTGTTYPITFPTEAGTVYGGTLDVVSGVMTVTHGYADLGTLNWSYQTLSSDRNGFSASISDLKEATRGSDLLPAIASCYKAGRYNDIWSHGIMSYFYPTGKTIIVINNDYTDATAFKTAMAGQKIVYELATPLTYQLTPIQVNSLLGANNVWNDTNGETEVKYIRDLNTTVNQLVQHLTYGYGGTPLFNGNDGDVHIVLDSFNKKKGEFMWLNNQWTLIEGSGEVALKLYDNGVEGVAWSVTGGTKNTTNISLTVGSGTFTNYAITNSAVNVTNYSTLTVVCKYRNQNYTKVIDLTNVSGNKYISFLYVTDSNHNECAVGLTDTNSPSPTYRVDSRNGGTAECIMYSCTLE